MLNERQKDTEQEKETITVGKKATGKLRKKMVPHHFPTIENNVVVCFAHLKQIN